MRAEVLSWNIWHGKFIDEIISFLKDKNVDIIGLQEVIEKTENNRKINQAKIIAGELGYNYVYYKAFTSDGPQEVYEQGNAILSKYPIIKSNCHFLSTEALYDKTAETEPRIAIETEIEINGRSLHVFTTHLAYSPRFENSHIRDLQVDNLMKILPKEKTILLGDFNSPPDSSYMEKLNKVINNTDRELTHPTWTLYPFDYHGFTETELRWRLDYIFTSFDITVNTFSVENSKASDHLPVSAIIEL